MIRLSEGYHKEVLMKVAKKDVINRPMLVPDKNEQEKIWSTVVKTEEIIEEQCYRFFNINILNV